jgi:hypothetical protein
MFKDLKKKVSLETAQQPHTLNYEFGSKVAFSRSILFEGHSQKS